MFNQHNNIVLASIEITYMFIGNNRSVLTPCISQCDLDDNDICIGCYRTADEITGWMNKSEDEKIDIVIRCKKLIAKKAENT
jgi:predicted Fe-S protein YdhL (DUF1289 family)